MDRKWEGWKNVLMLCRHKYLVLLVWRVVKYFNWFNTHPHRYELASITKVTSTTVFQSSWKIHGLCLTYHINLCFLENLEWWADDLEIDVFYTLVTVNIDAFKIFFMFVKHVRFISCTSGYSCRGEPGWAGKNSKLFVYFRKF